MIVTWYTFGMALDLAAVTRAVGGVCIPHRLPASTLVDGTAPLDSFVVVGNPDYTTLVTGAAETLERALASSPEDAHRLPPRDALVRATFVSQADTPRLRAALADAGMTAILGARGGGNTLAASLRALVADDQAAADRLVASGMQVLTQVARRGGVTAVIAELARRVDGWAVLLDAHGQVIATAGAGRLHVSDAVSFALGRPVRVRHNGLQMHRVGSEGDLAGTLVIATRSARTSHARDLSALAATLFDLLLRTHDPSRTELLGREALLDILIAGGDQAGALLQRWGVHERTMTAVELGTRTRSIDPIGLLRRWLDDLGAEHVFASDHGHVRGFVRDDLAEELAERVAAFTPVAGHRVHAGFGLPAPVTSLGLSVAQAHQALEAAVGSGVPAQRYADLPTVVFALAHVADAARTELTTLLAPLRASDVDPELVETLRVFLETHGAHRASASRLGIHRQTLVARVRRIEDLTGLSMHRADDRAAAWLALRAAAV